MVNQAVSHNIRTNLTPQSGCLNRLESFDADEVDELDAFEPETNSVPSLRLTHFLGYLEQSMRAPTENDTDLDVLKGVREEAHDPAQSRGQIKQRLKDWFEKKYDDRYLYENSNENNKSNDYMEAAQLARRVYMYTNDESYEFASDIQPMLIAADFGDSEVIQLLSTWGESLTTRDTEGLTPVMLAVRSCILSAVKTLGEMGANLTATTPIRKDTALHIAAVDGTPEIIEYLVGKNLSVDEKNIRGETALHLACAKDNPLNVKTLVSLGADPFNTTEQGANAIHIVSAAGSTSALQALFEHSTGKVDIDKPLQSGETPLHIAAERGHADIVSALLAYGTEIDREDANRETAVFKAAQSGHPNVLKDLHAFGADLTRPRATLGMETPFHAAAYAGHVETSRTLHRLTGVKESITDARGRTQAHYAICGEHKNISTLLEVLDECGVDLDQPDHEGLTPLHLAVALGNLPAIRTLIQFSAKVSSRSTDGYTPLDYAALYNQQGAAKLLCKLGVGLNLNLPKGRTTAHVAAAAGSTAVLKTFQQHRLSLESPDSEGFQPADVARKCDRPLTSHWLRQLSHSPS